jgi:hypothetical protein
MPTFHFYCQTQKIKYVPGMPWSAQRKIWPEAGFNGFALNRSKAHKTGDFDVHTEGPFFAVKIRNIQQTISIYPIHPMKIFRVIGADCGNFSLARSWLIAL